MMKLRYVIAFATVVVSLLGCGVNPATEFPNALLGTDGRPLILEELEDVANDPDLTAEEKRETFRDLGIEDEKLIDALLDL